jgi:hypothetical protein
VTRHDQGAAAAGVVNGAVVGEPHGSAEAIASEARRTTFRK